MLIEIIWDIFLIVFLITVITFFPVCIVYIWAYWRLEKTNNYFFTNRVCKEADAVFAFRIGNIAYLRYYNEFKGKNKIFKSDCKIPKNMEERTIHIQYTLDHQRVYDPNFCDLSCPDDPVVIKYEKTEFILRIIVLIQFAIILLAIIIGLL